MSVALGNESEKQWYAARKVLKKIFQVGAVEYQCREDPKLLPFKLERASAVSSRHCQAEKMTSSKRAL